MDTATLQSVKKARFDQVWDIVRPYKAQGLFPQESKIRIELPLENGKGQYIFDLKEATVNNVTTQRLNRNDVFVPNSLGVMLAIRHIVNGTPVETLYPYAPFNDGTNPSVHAVGFQNDNIKNLYQGFLQWLVDSTVMLESYPMEKFLKIPRQQGAFVLDSNDAAVQEGIQSEFELDKSLELLMPKYYIAGTRDHKITLNFPAAGLTFPLADANGVTTDYTAHIVLYMDGFLIKNGCQTFDGSGNGPFKEASGQW